MELGYGEADNQNDGEEAKRRSRGTSMEKRTASWQ